VQWPGHLVGRIFPPDSRDCVYFELAGVPQADSNVSGGGSWFAIPRSAPGFKEIYALLLTAKTTGMALTVETTGVAAGGACGVFAGVHQIYTTS
jgi:hypothetical protein